MQSQGFSGAKGGDEEFRPGEIVLIISGTFQSFSGNVISADTEAGKLKVLISFMSAWRTVELKFRDVKKTK